MSGLINNLLNDYLTEQGVSEETTPSPKNTEPKYPEMVNKARQMGQSPAMVEDLIKNNFGATPDKIVVDNAQPGEAIKFSGSADNPDFTANEQECCQHPTRPCKHWQWDTVSGEGYKNILSGRFREAD